MVFTQTSPKQIAVLTRPQSTLPNEYQQVEYIQSFGASGVDTARMGVYIDTGFKATSNTRVQFEAQFTDIDTQPSSNAKNQVYFGGRTGPGNTQFLLFGRGDQGNTHYQYSYQNTAPFMDAVSRGDIRQRHTYDIFQGNFTIDGQLVPISGTLPPDFATEYNMYIFGLNNGGNLGWAANMKLWYFKIFENDVLVRNFVPCYRKLDRMPGLYDTIGNTFYTDTGSSQGWFEVETPLVDATSIMMQVGGSEVEVWSPVIVPEARYELCFTAELGLCTIALNKTGSPTEVTLETSTDGTNWNTYTIGDEIQLVNSGDKVYRRNTSETDTRFSTSTSNFYKFTISGSVRASGDVTYLLNKNGTETLSSYCFSSLFQSNPGLISTPEIPVTRLGTYCCQYMFAQCENLETLPNLYTTGSLPNYCYAYMFYGCTKIKISQTSTSEYVNAYTIPGSGVFSYSTRYMFSNTGGTFTGTPTTGRTYYTSNQIIG